MLTPHTSPYVLVHRRDIIRPLDRSEARSLAAELAATGTEQEQLALEDDLIAGRVLVARRSEDRRCDDPADIPLISMARR
jgi:hypothetical protein